MSLQRFEGFDHLDDTGPLPPDLYAKGMRTLPATTLSYTAGKLAGNAIVLADSGDVLSIPYPTPIDDSIVGLWFRCTALPVTESLVIEWHALDVANAHVALHLLSSGALEMRQGAVVLATSSAGRISAGVWYPLEIHLVCHPTTGSVDVHHNGASVAAASSIDTTDSGSSDYDIENVSFHGSAGRSFAFDDFHLIDATVVTGHPVSFIGPSSVATLRADGDGTTSDFAGVGAGVANYDRVDDPAGPDFDTSYVRESTIGSIDLYTLEAIPAAYSGSTVVAVQTSMLAKKDSAGPKSVRTRVLSGATAALGATYALKDGYEYLTPQLMVHDPATSAVWDAAAVNALEAGWEIVV